MQLHDIQHLGVVGAGQMGAGIALVSAKAGWEVLLNDTNPGILETALTHIQKGFDRQIQENMISTQEADQAFQRIRTSRSLGDMVDVQLVIEAVPEQPDLKSRLFRELGMICKPDVILASNTSSISITKLGAAAGRNELVAGMHFMNPVPVMKLVEIIRGYNTSDETYQTVAKISKKLNKVPVEVNDYPGFVANRILMPMINEAIETLYNGVAGVKEIDTVMMFGMAHPMGPLALADFIGLDICLSILNVMHDGFKNPKYAPCPLLVNMVMAGKFGSKSGEGFYDYAENRKAEKVAKQFI